MGEGDVPDSPFWDDAFETSCGNTNMKNRCLCNNRITAWFDLFSKSSSELIIWNAFAASMPHFSSFSRSMNSWTISYPFACVLNIRAFASYILEKWEKGDTHAKSSRFSLRLSWSAFETHISFSRESTKVRIWLSLGCLFNTHAISLRRCCRRGSSLTAAISAAWSRRWLISGTGRTA